MPQPDHTPVQTFTPEPTPTPAVTSATLPTATPAGSPQQGGGNPSGGCSTGVSGSTDLSAGMLGGTMLAGIGLLLVRRRKELVPAASETGVQVQMARAPVRHRASPEHQHYLWTVRIHRSRQPALAERIPLPRVRPRRQRRRQRGQEHPAQGPRPLSAQTTWLDAPPGPHSGQQT